jgi:hypothetical protein
LSIILYGQVLPYIHTYSANNICIAIRSVLRKRLCPREHVARGSLHACDMCLKERSKPGPKPLGSVETLNRTNNVSGKEKEKTVTTRAQMPDLLGRYGTGSKSSVARQSLL